MDKRITTDYEHCDLIPAHTNTIIAQAEGPVITVLDFTDTEYTVEQSFVRNKYKAINSDRKPVLKGKQKLFKAKEEVPFIDANGEDAFTLRPNRIIDIADDYALIDSPR